MEKVNPEFCPPRAGRLSGVRNAVFAGRRVLGRWERTRQKRRLPVARTLWVACVPAYGFAVRGYVVVGWIALVVWVAAAGVLLVYLGQDAANYATAVLVGIHTAGVCCGFHRSVFLPTRRSGNAPEIFAMFLFVLVGYLLTFQAVRSVVFPVEHGSGVVVLNGWTFVRKLERGDMVGYRMRERGYGQVQVRGGYALERVVALPGDRVVFRGNAVEVAGMEYPSVAWMPKSGEMVVPKDRWLIWPSSSLSGRGELESNAVTEAISRVALVPKRDIVGKPFEHWFWRKQEYEPVQ